MTSGFDEYCVFLQRIDSGCVAELRNHAASDVHFRDPFNDVHDVEAMIDVFDDMFVHVKDLNFRIHHRMSDGDVCIIVWTLSGRLMDRDWSVDGASQLRFNDQGLLVEHIDHWDAAAGLYEKLPVIGWVLRRLRKRLEVSK